MEGGGKIDSPQKRRDALRKSTHTRFVFIKRPREPVDTVIEAIKKKRNEAKDMYQIALDELVAGSEQRDCLHHVKWLEEQVIALNKDPNKIIFNIMVFSQTVEAVWFTSHFHVRKEKAIANLKKHGHEDMIPHYLEEYRKFVLGLMQTLVTKWNEKHPTLLAEIVIPKDRSDVQYYFSNKK